MSRREDPTTIPESTLQAAIEAYWEAMHALPAFATGPNPPKGMQPAPAGYEALRDLVANIGTALADYEKAVRPLIEQHEAACAEHPLAGWQPEMQVKGQWLPTTRPTSAQMRSPLRPPLAPLFAIQSAHSALSRLIERAENKPGGKGKNLALVAFAMPIREWSLVSGTLKAWTRGTERKLNPAERRLAAAIEQANEYLLGLEGAEENGYTAASPPIPLPTDAGERTEVLRTVVGAAKTAADKATKGAQKAAAPVASASLSVDGEAVASERF